MKHVEAFPCDVVETEDMGVALPDGRRLSARVWMPTSAAKRPVPAILEYLPYRKRDGTAARDALTHPYLAGHGYACLRVDIAGTGESEGLFDDEYSEQELSDGEAAIAWIAAQDWCDGSVGMIGISWGGFNGLQLAARRPAALKAVVSICSTADRYADDIHYKGGCMLGENVGWAATVLGWFGLPPDPALAGEAWRATWLARLEATPFLASKWARRQTRDDYWRRGSVCENYAAIEAAVLSVGGWHDGYRNTISHLVSNLSSPVKGVVGPWNHKYPHFARPGPTIGFVQETLRWFDRWLKGELNGAERDPAYRAYLMDGVAPAVDYDHRPGRWIAEAEWPSPRIEPVLFRLGADGLGDAGAPFVKTVETNVACGLCAGEYFPFGFGPGELPDDQRADDALSACFDGAPVKSSLDVVGAPRVTLEIAADRSRAQIAVRLCDVSPDGSSTLIAHGFLNLRHRAGHERPADLEPGTPYQIALDLDECAYRLPQGHRLRLAVSPSYWPFIWPEEENVTLSISGGSLALPVRPAANGDEWTFEEAEAAAPLAIRRLTEAREEKSVEHDDVTGETRIVIASDEGLVEAPHTGLVTGVRLREVWFIRDGDPASARADFEWERTMARGDWSVRTVARLAQWTDKGRFLLAGELEAFEGADRVFRKTFNDAIERN